MLILNGTTKVPTVPPMLTVSVKEPSDTAATVALTPAVKVNLLSTIVFEVMLPRGAVDLQPIESGSRAKLVAEPILGWRTRRAVAHRISGLLKR